MLRGGAWCAGVAVFVILTGLCSWLAYRTGHISKARTRANSWIDVSPPYEDYDDDLTTQFDLTPSEAHEENLFHVNNPSKNIPVDSSELKLSEIAGPPPDMILETTPARTMIPRTSDLVPDPTPPYKFF